MTSILLLAAVQTSSAPTSGKLLDLAINAHKKLKKVSATVTHQDTLQKKLSTTKHEVQLIVGDSMRVRSVNKAVALDRIFIVKGGTGFAQDNPSKEWLSKKVDPKYPLTQRFVELAGAIDEPLKYLADSSSMSELLEVLKKTGRWAVTSTPSEYVLQSGSSNAGMTLKLSKKQSYVTYLKVVNAGGANTIQYAYGQPPASISVPVSGVGTKVSNFGSAVRSPKYVNASAKSLAAKVWTRYESFKSVSYSYASESQNMNAAFSGDRFKFKSAGWDWAYDGARLTVLNHSSKKYWQMKTEKGNILFRLTKAKAPTEPWIRSLLATGHPLSGLYKSTLSMKVKGSFGSAKSMTDLLEISSKNGRSTLEVQRSTGLIQGYISQQLDNRGRVIGSSDGTYKYLSVDATLPDSSFRLTVPAGYKQEKFGD